MSYLDDIRSDLAHSEHQQISQGHAQALIDAMTLAMAAEGELNEVEHTQLDRITSAMDERTPLDVASYVEQSIEAASQVAGDADALAQRARDIAGRLDDETLRDEAYYLATRIAVVDINVDVQETQVLSALVEALDISRERQARITKRLREVM